MHEQLNTNFTVKDLRHILNVRNGYNIVISGGGWKNRGVGGLNYCSILYKGRL